MVTFGSIEYCKPKNINMELALSFRIIISYPLLSVTLKESVAQLLQHSNSNPLLQNKHLLNILLSKTE